MYDYVELFSDKTYSKFLPIAEFHALFSSSPEIQQSSNASFTWKMGEYQIRIQGIQCDSNGNYQFETDNDFNSINLIEFNLPQNSESHYENEIKTFISEIAEKINWVVNWRD